MSVINLYKIEPSKVTAFTQDLQKRMNRIKTVDRTVLSSGIGAETFGMTLYLSHPDDTRGISWNWILQEFDRPDIQVNLSPKAVIMIESEDDVVYAVTFGHSFFAVDKFCERDFGFDFARRLKYKAIKTTTLTTPSSHRNKTVNTYINYNELEFDSGESFAKLKAEVDVAEGFELYKPAIEIGSSIRFTTSEDTLEGVLNLIVHVEDTIRNCPETCKIPVFTKVKDAALLQRLNERLEQNIGRDPAQINISELDIIGAVEVFNSNDSEFDLVYQRKAKKVSALSTEVIRQFCEENGWDYAKCMLNVGVTSYYGGSPVVTKRVREIIDYTDDGEMCLLSKGTWYSYNDDYLSYLKDSIKEIDAEYHPEYDFDSEEYADFIDRKYVLLKDSPEYLGKSASTIKASLKRRFYAERAFNLLREEQDGFQNCDRLPTYVGGATVEKMDLYKNGLMCAVKIGNTSGKLCYAVDQSLESLRLYKKGLLPDMPEINSVCLWFVLERTGHIEDQDGTPDINQLNLLMLKNKLDQWKKEVRLLGYRPLIYINYRQN